MQIFAFSKNNQTALFHIIDILNQATFKTFCLESHNNLKNLIKKKHSQNSQGRFLLILFLLFSFFETGRSKHECELQKKILKNTAENLKSTTTYKSTAQVRW